MGRKRSRKMERLFLYLTCGMILLTCALGCMSLNQQVKQEDPWGMTAAAGALASADTEIANGNFPLALQKNEDILARLPGMLEDQVLYQRGFIHAHPRNPEQNITKAIDAFRELKNNFPGSKLRVEAEVWMITLEGLQQKEQAIGAIKKERQKHEKTIAQLNTQATTRQAIIKQLNLQVSQLETQISQLEGQVSQLESQVSQLEGQLERLKKVDLGIEEKKRTRSER